MFALRIRDTFHNMTAGAALVALIIGGVGCAPAEQPCNRDTDCKGDRVCEAGVCTEPGGGSGGAGGTTGTSSGGTSCKDVGGTKVCLQTSSPVSNKGTSVGTIPIPPGGLPSSASISTNGFAIPNQGACGSCAAFATKNAMALRDIVQSAQSNDFSAAHIWHIAGYGAESCDTGSYIDVIFSANTAQEAHVVPTSTWPYDPSNPQDSLNAIPSQGTLDAQGIAYIQSSLPIASNDVLDLKAAIAQNWPPVIGVDVYWSSGWNDNGFIVLPDPNQVPDGAHAVVLVSYDDATSTFGFANSWGNWGQNGFGTMTYEFVEQHSYGGVAVKSLSYAGSTVTCGDGMCSLGENCSSCASDCGACPPGCPDGECNGGESCSSCPQDCGACPPQCPDGQCNGNENCSSCPQDCGACPPGCPDGQCNGNETCSSCPQDCGACPPQCPDGQCNGNENCSSCPQDCGACCQDTYQVTSYACNAYSSASGGGNGGGEIFKVCGDINPTTGYVTIQATKYDGSTFGNRPYQVRVSSAGDIPCGPDAYGFVVSDSNPSGIGTTTLTFDFQSNWLAGQTAKAYCVTASTKSGDPGYDANNPQQTSWWYSKKVGVLKSCQ